VGARRRHRALLVFHIEVREQKTTTVDDNQSGGNDRPRRADIFSCPIGISMVHNTSAFEKALWSESIQAVLLRPVKAVTKVIDSYGWIPRGKPMLPIPDMTIQPRHSRRHLSALVAPDNRPSWTAVFFAFLPSFS